MSNVTAGTSASRDGSQLKIFISYSRQDLAAADDIVKALELNGFIVLIDRRDLPYGEEWRKEIADLIRASDTVAWLVSTHSVSSKWCRWELGEVKHLNKRLVPVVISTVPIDELPEIISDIHLLPAEGLFSLEAHLDVLLRTLSANRGWLKEATRLADRAQKWLASDRLDDHLLQGRALREAQQWIDVRPPDVPPPSQEQLDFIMASQRAQRRRSRIFTTALSAIAVMAVLAATATAWLYLGREDALLHAQRQTEAAIAAQENESTQRAIAQNNEKEATRERDRALQTESRFLSDLAQQQTARGDATTGMLLGLAALPDPTATVVRPYVPEAELQLFLAGNETRELHIWQLPELAGRVALADDGEHLIHDQNSSDTALWHVTSGRKLRGLARATGSIAPFFSPDGKAVVVTENEHRLTFLDTVTGDAVFHLDVPASHGAIKYAQVSRNMAIAAIGTNDKILRFYDLKGGREISSLDEISQGTFSPDGSLYVTGHGESRDGTYPGYAIAWDVTTGSKKFQLEEDQGWVQLIKFSPTGDRFLTATTATAVCCEFRSLIHLWDTKSGKLVAVLKGHERSIAGVDFSPDGRWIVSTSNDDTVRLWQAEDGTTSGPVLIRHTGSLNKSSFSSDSNSIATIGYDGTLWLTTLPREKDQQPATQIVRGASKGRSDVRFVGDSHYIATVSDDKSIRIWDGRPGSVLFRHEEHAMSERVQISSARRPLNPRDNIFTLGDWRPGAIISEKTHPAAPTAEPPVLNVPERYAATLTKGILRIAAATSGEEVFATAPGEISVRRAAFSADGSMLALVGRPPGGRSDEIVVQFRRSATWATYAQEHIFDTDESFTLDAVKGLAVVGLRSGQFRVWNLASGTKLAERIDEGRRPVALAIFSADADFLLTASGDGSAVVWATNDWRPVATLRGHRQRLTGADFDTARRRVLTTSHDWTARLWDLRSGEQLAVLRGHDDATRRPRFLESGTVAEAQSESRTIQWKLLPSTEDLIRHVIDHVPRCLSPEQRALYNLDPDPPAWCIAGRKWPYQPEVFVARANAHKDGRNYAAALSALDWAARLKPDDAEIRFARGQVQEALLELDRAIADYGEASRLAPGEPKYRFYRGMSLLRVGSLQAALDEFDSVVAADEQNAAYRAARARVLLQTGKHAEATRDIGIALQAAPNSPVYRSLYASILLETSRPAEALEELNLSLQQRGDPVQYFLRARAHEQLGFTRFALADYSVATRGIPRSEGFELAQNRSAIDAARAQLARSSIVANGAAAEEHWKRGLQMLDAGNYEDAVNSFSEVLIHFPGGENAFNLRGIGYRRSGRLDLALADFSEFVRSGIADIGYNNRAFALWKAGRLEQALDDAERAIRIKETDYALTTRASIRRDLGRFDEALRDYDRVLAISPDSIAAWVGRGRTYHRQGKQDGAMADYRKALALVSQDRGDQEDQEQARLWLKELDDEANGQPAAGRP